MPLHDITMENNNFYHLQFENKKKEKSLLKQFTRIINEATSNETETMIFKPNLTKCIKGKCLREQGVHKI